MIYRLAHHIHFVGRDSTKTSNIRDLLDFFSDYDILILVLHSSETTEEFYSSFVKECEKNSTPNKLIIPCLEDESKLYHLLLVGAISHPQDVFNPHRGYLTVLAHPWGYGYYKRKVKKENLNLEELDGIEVWNISHNSEKYPSLKTLKFFKRLPKKIKAYIGSDDHPPYKKLDATIFINCENLKKESVLKALKEGSFYNQFKDFSLSSDGEFKKGNRMINNRIKMKCLIHERLIHLLSLLTYTGDRSLDLFNIKQHQKYQIIKFVEWLRKNL